MDSIRRYYTLREAAEALGIPLHQARRWVKTFLPGPPKGRIRLSQKDLERLQRVYQGFYAHRLRGQALKTFVCSMAPVQGPAEPYALLREVQKRLKALEDRLSELATPPPSPPEE